MATPSINGQLGWENGTPHYILAWDHRKGQPRISQRIELEYSYGKEFIDFTVEYVPGNAEKTVRSYDDMLAVTVERASWGTHDADDLYIAIASGYANETVSPPHNLTVRGRPYYITALNPATKSEIIDLPRSLRFDLNGEASLDKLYHLATYTDYKGQERQFWTLVDEPSEVQHLGVYAIMTDAIQDVDSNGAQG